MAIDKDYVKALNAKIIQLHDEKARLQHERVVYKLKNCDHKLIPTGRIGDNKPYCRHCYLPGDIITTSTRLKVQDVDEQCDYSRYY